MGYAGTLDPLATGLMILATGTFTKKLTLLTDLDKKYDATITLGAVTEGYDLETQPTWVADTAHLSIHDIEETLDLFRGTITQVPPIHSAVKVGGKRAYSMARKGQEVEIPSRQVEIYSLELTEVSLPEIFIKVHCSKGTYIRTLANDIGKKLQVGAYLSSLRRTAIGEFRVEDAKTPQAWLEAWNMDKAI